MNRSIGYIYKSSSNVIRNNVKFATVSSLPKSNIFSNTNNINTFTTASSTPTTTSTTTPSNSLSSFQNNKSNKINVNSIKSTGISSLLQYISYGDDDGT